MHDASRTGISSFSTFFIEIVNSHFHYRNESYMKYIRERHGHSNRHNASRDIATGFARLQHLRFLFRGGCVQVDGNYRCCGEGVLTMASTPLFHRYLFQTQERLRSHQPGQPRIKSESHPTSPGEFYTAMELLQVTRLIGEEVTQVKSFDGVNDKSGNLCRLHSQVKCRVKGKDMYGTLIKTAMVNQDKIICHILPMRENGTYFNNPMYKQSTSCVAIKSHHVVEMAAFTHLCTSDCKIDKHDIIESDIFIYNSFFLGQ
ncbi:uncharacterized protein [Amphiura filiformis]|uniref:uncharacterized protein n=1 Tax=Amphiura filiformis TaxID=82378 RepID=UPI003B20B94D